MKRIALLTVLLWAASTGATDYYIDYTNGVAGDGQTGLKSANLTVDSTADTTHFVDAALTGANDYINGAFVYNVTHPAAAPVYVSDFDAASDTVTLSGVNAGLTAGDTYYYIDSWKTIQKFTGNARTAGDRAFLRANMTHTQGAADITFTSDGSSTAYLELIGCDAITNDPWHDASSVKPIVDFADGAYRLNIEGDCFWKVSRLDFQRGAHAAGLISIADSWGCLIEDCNFSDMASTGVEAIYGGGTSDCTVNDCNFIATVGPCIGTSGGSVTVTNSVFDGGGGTTYAIYCSNGGTVIANHCSFGETTAFATNTITAVSGTVYTRDCTYVASPPADSCTGDGIIYIEDGDGVFEAHTTITPSGTISRATASPRTGGADSYAIMAPGSTCNTTYPPLVLGDKNTGFSRIWLPAGSRTITVYARVGDAWDVAPAADSVYTTASYLDSATAGIATRTMVTSSGVTLNNTDSWTTGVHAIPVTVAPLKEGWVYLWLYVSQYDASDVIWVDIRPVVTGYDEFRYEWIGGQPHVTLGTHQGGGSTFDVGFE